MAWEKSKPTIKWTLEMRLALFLIYDGGFEEPGDASVFNQMFKKHLTHCGFPYGAGKGQLSSQYGERKKDMNKDWVFIMQQPPSAAMEELKARIRLQCQETAAQLHLSNHGNTSTIKTQASLYYSTPQSDSRRSLQETTDFTPSEPIRTKQSSKLSHAGVSWRKVTTVKPLDSHLSVMVPRKETQMARSLATPPKTPKKKSPPTGTFQLVRWDGSTINAPEHRRTEIEKELVSVREEAAHPKPLPGILFRYWKKRDHLNHDNETIFWARKYYRSNIIHHKPPKAEEIDFTDVANHLNRFKKDTPFISTSSCLIWIIREALKEVQKGEQNGKISIICSKALDPRAIFYVRPFHDAVKKKYGLTNGTWRYAGTYEYWVWRSVRREAIIKTLDVVDLMHFVHSAPALSQVLRFEIITTWASLDNKRRMLREQKLQLSAGIAGCMADLMLFMGLTSTSPTEQVSHIVSELVYGWGFLIEWRASEEWAKMATAFANTMSKDRPMALREQQMFKFSFLLGLFFACGQPNASHKPDLVVKMQRKAERVGLGSPAKIIADEQDAVKLAILMEGKKVDRLIRSGPQQRRVLWTHRTADDDDDVLMEDDNGNGMDDGDFEMIDVNDSPSRHSRVSGIALDDDDIIYDDDLLGL